MARWTLKKKLLRTCDSMKTVFGIFTNGTKYAVRAQIEKEKWGKSVEVDSYNEALAEVKRRVERFRRARKQLKENIPPGIKVAGRYTVTKYVAGDLNDRTTGEEVAKISYAIYRFDTKNGPRYGALVLVRNRPALWPFPEYDSEDKAEKAAIKRLETLDQLFYFYSPSRSKD